MKKRLCLKDALGRFYPKLSHIVRLEADGCYTVFYLVNGSVHTQSGPIGSYYDRIKQEDLFFRIHKSHVINLLFVYRIENCGFVIMLDGARLPISQNFQQGA